MTDGRSPASFRDPAGFVFFEDGVPLRQVNESYRRELEHLESSGLYQELTEAGLIIPHRRRTPSQGQNAVAVLQPEAVPIISYPYEWSFSQLKDAAECTLEVQRRALARGMTLKDASAFNIQFLRGRPVLIDTLSFELYEPGAPWFAYRQFCEHFLAPLALWAHVDGRLAALLRSYIDGIPLELAARLLPVRAKATPGLLIHIGLHASAQRRASDSQGATRAGSVSRAGMSGLIDSLAGTIRGLQWRPPRSEWSHYYAQTNYSEESMAAKRRIVSSFVARLSGSCRIAWDLGANTGEFSSILADAGMATAAWDADLSSVETHYIRVKASGADILPLVQDLANPSAGIGWAGQERMSLSERGPADLAVALALVHHLAIGNNVPLKEIAQYFARLCKNLIIEFVPREDSQVQRLLATRRDIYGGYTRDAFEAAFRARFAIEEIEPVPGSERTLFRMSRIEVA